MLKVGGGFGLIVGVASLLGAPFILTHLSNLRYFDPAHLQQTTVSCEPSAWQRVFYPETDSQTFHEPALHDWMISGYADAWTAAGEPSLFELSQQSEGRGARIYRLSRFGRGGGLVVTLTEATPGELSLSAKWFHLNASGQAREMQTTERVLTAAETTAFEQLLTREPISDIGAHSCIHMSHGHSVVLESVERGNYQFAQRAAPDRGALFEYEVTFSNLTKWDFWRYPEGLTDMEEAFREEQRELDLAGGEIVVQ